MTLARLAHVIDRIAFPDDVQSRKELAVGLAVQFLQRQWGTNRVGPHLKRVLTAIDASQYEFYFDRIGRSLGFVTWALFTEETSQILSASGLAAIPQEGWNDGSCLWIVDFFARDGSIQGMLADLFSHAFSAHDTARYFRHKGQSSLLKQISRRDRFAGVLPDASLRPAYDVAPLTTNAILLGDCEEVFADAQEIGRCVLALDYAGVSANAPLWRSSYLLGEFVGLRQFRLYFSSEGIPAGLLTWAWLSERTISRIAQVPLHDVHSAEWNEGERLCLCYAVFSESVRKDMLADMQRGLFPEESTLLLYVPPAQETPARLIEIERTRQGGEIDNWLTHVSAGTS